MLYEIIDSLIYIKYFIYFIFLINSLFFNYVFIKYFLFQINFLKNLYFNINLNGAFAIKLVQWTITQFKFIEDTSSNQKIYFKFVFKFYEKIIFIVLIIQLSILNNNLPFDFNKHFIFDDTFTIKSGSIAQIYKIKCINTYITMIYNF